MNSTTDRALTEMDTAARLGLSVSTLKRWRLSGVCPIKPLPGMGRTVRYSEAELRRYLEGRGSDHDRR